MVVDVTQAPHPKIGGAAPMHIYGITCGSRLELVNGCCWFLGYPSTKGPPDNSMLSNNRNCQV